MTSFSKELNLEILLERFWFLAISPQPVRFLQVTLALTQMFSPFNFQWPPSRDRKPFYKQVTRV